MTQLSLAQLLQGSGQVEPAQLADMELWNPSNCGHMNLTIKANGQWWHEGVQMLRPKLINLLASVLWAEPYDSGLCYFLKTPVEKIQINVEDVPLLITDVERDNSGVWYVQTATGDCTPIDHAHPIELRSYNGQVRPYVLIRRNLWALVHRNSYYHLLAQSAIGADGTATLHSGNCTFTLCEPNDSQC